MKTKRSRPTKNALRKRGINPVRKTNEHGQRVWVVGDKEYYSLREIVDAFKVQFV